MSSIFNRLFNKPRDFTKPSKTVTRRRISAPSPVASGVRQIRVVGGFEEASAMADAPYKSLRGTLAAVNLAASFHTDIAANPKLRASQKRGAMLVRISYAPGTNLQQLRRRQSMGIEATQLGARMCVAHRDGRLDLYTWFVPGTPLAKPIKKVRFAANVVG